jgi:hydroxymethylpyrimidine/phosphomethylpyrimidine kinase
MNIEPDEFRPPIVLTVAGSDSGGAAGMQADIRTFATLGVHGMSVLTVVTAQNSQKVEAVRPMSPAFVAKQLDTVLSDYGADAVKTGFIGRARLIDAVAAKLRQATVPHVVVDPVLVDHQGKSMFDSEVSDATIKQLLPLADLITPNRPEAALLTGRPDPGSVDLEWLKTVSERLFALGPNHILLKGGRMGTESVDHYFDGSNHTLLTSPWIETRNTHGSGDTLSAAICALLARGFPLLKSVIKAREYTAAAISRSAAWHLGAGHGPVDQANLSMPVF